MSFPRSVPFVAMPTCIIGPTTLQGDDARRMLSVRAAQNGGYQLVYSHDHDEEVVCVCRGILVEKNLPPIETKKQYVVQYAGIDVSPMS